jgi:LysR family transcriptional regulator, low CO2-responsive transcriptional regulator
MVLNQIELFVTVAKHRNLGKTARQLHVSVSSVCQRLKSLENELGAKLYTKKKYGIELTTEGQTLLRTASEVLDQLESVRKVLTHHVETAVESLSVGATYNPAVKYLPSAIATFQKAHPYIKLTFLSSHRADLEEWLRKGEMEIAVIQSPAASTDFILEHFASDNFTFFAHPAHPLARKQKLAARDLDGVPVILRDGIAATPKALKQLERSGITLNIVLRCATPDAVKSAVRTKMGIGLLFLNVVEEDFKKKELKRLRFTGLPKLMGDSYIVYCKNKPLSRAAVDFVAVLRSMKAPRQRHPGSRKSREQTAIRA